MHKNFCVFILSHGRPGNIKTLKTLEKAGYTGDIKIICDDEDETLPEYQEGYGDKVIVFSRDDAVVDMGDLSGARNVVVHARNMCHKIARAEGYEYFLVLDDDYTNMRYRYPKDGELLSANLKRADILFSEMCKFLDVSGACAVALSQSGDYLGGIEGPYWNKGISRKVMNSFFCKTDRPFSFLGRINEDTTTYTLLGSRGVLFMSITDYSIDQERTQAQEGGLTDAYLDSGTYVKSFYSVMMMPSAVAVRAMGDSHLRAHHQVSWRHCVPKILSDRHKKRTHV